MAFLREYLLTLLIFLPTAGAVVVLFQRNRDTVRWTALATTLVTFVGSLLLLLPGLFDWNLAGVYDYAGGGGGVVQLVHETSWIPAFHIKYKVGIDGLSFPLLVLSTFISALACVASLRVEKMVRGYFA